MNIAALSLFLGASVALIVTPGPDTMYVLTRVVERGRRARVQAASGVSTGILVHTMVRCWDSPSSFARPPWRTPP
nr:hypothetical protein [Haladaptatus halobius]